MPEVTPPTPPSEDEAGGNAAPDDAEPDPIEEEGDFASVKSDDPMETDDADKESEAGGNAVPQPSETGSSANSESILMRIHLGAEIFDHCHGYTTQADKIYDNPDQ